ALPITDFSHWVTVPSVTLSPRAGIFTDSDMAAESPSWCFSCGNAGAYRPGPVQPHPMIRSVWDVRGSVVRRLEGKPPNSPTTALLRSVPPSCHPGGEHPR